MASVSVSTTCNVDIKLTEEEVETLKKAHEVLKKISSELWQDDADETDAFGNVSAAQDGIYYFLKNDCGINVDERRVW